MSLLRLPRHGEGQMMLNLSARAQLVFSHDPNRTFGLLATGRGYGLNEPVAGLPPLRCYAGSYVQECASWHKLGKEGQTQK